MVLSSFLSIATIAEGTFHRTCPGIFTVCARIYHVSKIPCFRFTMKPNNVEKKMKYIVEPNILELR